METKTEQKERTHTAILESAARLVRAKGITGAKVADVMGAAHLTVGGFYAHFDSKAHLVDEALKRMGARLRDGLFARMDEIAPAERITVVIKRYLSPKHRDLDGDGCALPAVVSEIATTAPEHRKTLHAEVEALASGIGEHLNAPTSVPRRQLALAMVAMMFGGLALSRALRGTPLSDEILKSCRAAGISLTHTLEKP
jgi:TetR/AcrR family transcriptional regulator, transcriptional repressor for nem operon